MYLKIFLTGKKLLNNVVSISAIQQHQSVVTIYAYIYVCIYIYLPSLLTTSLPPSHPSRSSQGTRLGSLCYIATSLNLAILHMVVCIYVNATFSICPTFSLPRLCPQVCSLCLRLHSADRFIRTIFLDSIMDSSMEIL